MLEVGEELDYDRLILCVGAKSRPLTCPGAELAGVHYLRGIADVAAIREGLKPGARVVIIGGGYIGLETAATARHLGCTRHGSRNGGSGHEPGRGLQRLGVLRP